MRRRVAAPEAGARAAVAALAVAPAVLGAQGDMAVREARAAAALAVPGAAAETAGTAARATAETGVATADLPALVTTGTTGGRAKTVTVAPAAILIVTADGA